MCEVLLYNRFMRFYYCILWFHSPINGLHQNCNTLKHVRGVWDYLPFFLYKLFLCLIRINIDCSKWTQYEKFGWNWCRRFWLVVGMNMRWQKHMLEQQLWQQWLDQQEGWLLSQLKLQRVICFDEGKVDI